MPLRERRETQDRVPETVRAAEREDVTKGRGETVPVPVHEETEEPVPMKRGRTGLRVRQERERDMTETSIILIHCAFLGISRGGGGGHCAREQGE